MLQRKIVERQRDLGLRDGQMAARLGIPRTSYSTIKFGKHRLSLKTARRIAAAFPELIPYILAPDEEPPK